MQLSFRYKMGLCILKENLLIIKELQVLYWEQSKIKEKVTETHETDVESFMGNIIKRPFYGIAYCFFTENCQNLKFEIWKINVSVEEVKHFRHWQSCKTTSVTLYMTVSIKL